MFLFLVLVHNTHASAVQKFAAQKNRCCGDSRHRFFVHRHIGFSCFTERPVSNWFALSLPTSFPCPCPPSSFHILKHFALWRFWSSLCGLGGLKIRVAKLNRKSPKSIFHPSKIMKKLKNLKNVCEIGQLFQKCTFAGNFNFLTLINENQCKLHFEPINFVGLKSCCAFTIPSKFIPPPMIAVYEICFYPNKFLS